MAVAHAVGSRTRLELHAALRRRQEEEALHVRWGRDARVRLALEGVPDSTRVNQRPQHQNLDERRGYALLLVLIIPLLKDGDCVVDVRRRGHVPDELQREASTGDEYSLERDGRGARAAARAALAGPRVAVVTRALVRGGDHVPAVCEAVARPHLPARIDLRAVVAVATEPGCAGAREAARQVRADRVRATRRTRTLVHVAAALDAVPFEPRAARAVCGRPVDHRAAANLQGTRRVHLVRKEGRGASS